MKPGSTSSPEAETKLPRRDRAGDTPFEYKSAAGFLIAFLLSLLIGVVSAYTLRAVDSSRARLESIYAGEVVELGRLRATAARKSADARAYLLTRNPVFLDERKAAAAEFSESLESFGARAASPSERETVERIERTQRAYREATEKLIASTASGKPREEVARMFEREAAPRVADLEDAIEALDRSVDERLSKARTAAVESASRSVRLVLVVAGSAMMLAAGLGLLFLRTMKRLRRAADERMAAVAGERAARLEADAANAELAATVQRLEQVNEDLDAFAGRVAHDLRNVLTPFSLAATLLRKAKDVEQIGVIAASLSRTSSRASTVLDGLLAFSRAGHPADGCGAADVREVVAEVVEELSPLALEVDAALVTEVEDVRVQCSPELLHVVVLNLLGNAIKFVGGRERREIAVRACIRDERVELTVQDTGPGIPEDAMGRIFEPFFRVAGVRASGTGIGLATVRRIVSAHGGCVECSSVLGEGTTFRVSLRRVA